MNKKKGKYFLFFIFIVLLLFSIFKLLILDDYKSMYVSSTILESKEQKSFINEYYFEIDSLGEDESLIKKINLSVNSIWSEHMWGYFRNDFLKSTIHYSDEKYLVISHLGAINKPFDTNYKEVFFFNSKRSYNFSQKEQIIKMSEKTDSLKFEVWLNACNNEEPEFKGTIMLFKK